MPVTTSRSVFVLTLLAPVFAVAQTSPTILRVDTALDGRGGTIEKTPGGDILVSSPGIFTYSRRSAPFGFNGAYWYAGVSYDF